MTNAFKNSCLALLILFAQGAGMAQPQTSAGAEEEFAEKKTETKFTEVVSTDSIPASELLKRAVTWIKSENANYRKSGGVTTGSKAECIASFPIKPKTLNPSVDYTGKITMKVLIECKDNRFRYTVSDIRHVSKNGRTSAGSIDNKVPECGSMTMDEVVYKKLKGEALRNAGQVVADLKTGMSAYVSEGESEEW